MQNATFKWTNSIDNNSILQYYSLLNSYYEQVLFQVLYLFYLILTIILFNVNVKSLSRVRLFATPWTVAYQAPLSMGFSRQQYWSGLPFLSQGDLPDLGIEPGSPSLQTDALQSEPPGKSSYISLSPFSGWGGKNTGVGCQSLLQEIFPTQGSNPDLPHSRQILYHLSHLGNPCMIFRIP